MRPQILIKAGERFSGIVKFERLIENHVNLPIVCISDPYISIETLSRLSKLIGKTEELKILTGEIKESNKIPLMERFDDFKNEGSMKGEIRILGEKVDGKFKTQLHDRYLLCMDFKEERVMTWSLGHSIKNLGEKDAVIYPVNELSDSLKALFHLRWERASNLV